MEKGKRILTLKTCLPILIITICLNSCVKNISSSFLGQGWSSNSINTVKFRKNALTTAQGLQFVAYYDENGFLVLGKRKVHVAKWEVLKTPYKGNIKDAHNSISIAVDGNGFLHVSWDHHDSKLRYAMSKEPFGLELGGEMGMTGTQEEKVTYPQFYNLPNGNLMFFYRSGKSGRGNLVINTYNIVSKKWDQIQDNLIDGEDKRSAYWQACVDAKGTIHISWVWRETWDVETNHDLCYARSLDGGLTWEKSTGETYKLPIRMSSAENAWRIPQKSNLINQTAMSADANSNPYIVSYWSENDITQYQIVYLDSRHWKKANTGFRKTNFELGGGGTKKIPISRPDILIDEKGDDILVSILFRDEELGNRVSLAYASLKQMNIWQVINLTEDSVRDWEPNYDISLWQQKRELHVLMQNVTQIDGEGLAHNQASNINVLVVKNIEKVISGQ